MNKVSASGGAEGISINFLSSPSHVCETIRVSHGLGYIMRTRALEDNVMISWWSCTTYCSHVLGRSSHHIEYEYVPNVMHREACACRTCGILFDMDRGGRKEVCCLVSRRGACLHEEEGGASRVKMKNVVCDYRSDVG